MKEQLVSFETAKLAKEKGFKFDEEHEDHDEFYKYSGYYKYGRIDEREWSLESVYDIETLHWGSELTETIDTPTQSLLQKWLRDIHNVHFHIIHIQNSNNYEISLIKEPGYKILNIELRDSYENLLEIALQEALKLI